MDEDKPNNIEQILDRLLAVRNASARVSVDDLLQTAGQTSFGSLILVIGLLLVSPLSAIPTLPTTLGMIVILLAAQLLAGRSHFWLPGFLRRRSIARPRVDRGVRFLRPSARYIDQRLRSRIRLLTGRRGTQINAVFCILIGITIPPLEIVPFLSSLAGVALTAFGLALISHDGLVELFAIAFTTGIIVLGVLNLL